MAEHRDSSPDSDPEAKRDVEPAREPDVDAGSNVQGREAPPRDVVRTKGNGNAPLQHAAASTAGHAADGHAGHDHGLAHTTPVSLLVGVLGALMVLTVVTVAVTSVDLGAQGNLVVAMVIATIKAALVVLFFMHLVWDKKLHLILFLTSVLFVILFLSMSVADRSEYQSTIDTFQASEPAK